MYKKILEILKQNQIPCENIAYTNEFGTLILNNGEEFEEYIAGMDSNTHTSYLLIYQDKKERKFDIITQVNIQGITVYILKENF